MKKKIFVIATVSVLVLVSLVGYFYLSRQEDQPQVFKLKIGEKGVYKGNFDLEIKLVEIGKIKDVLNTPRFSEEQFQIIAEVECEEDDCSDIREDTYYVLKTKNLDWVQVCGEAREVIIAKSSIKGYYDCPSFYIFEINPLGSNDDQVEFVVEYNPVTTE